MAKKEDIQHDASLDDLFKDVKDAIGEIDVPVEKQNVTKKYTPPPARKIDADETTFPTEMNCSQVFDQLLKCYSLGGQLRNYYRYGEISYCFDKRNKMKFCLGTKLMSEADRKEKIKHWHMEHLAEQQTKKQTSEVVWKSREVPFRLPFREDSEKYLNETNN